MLAVCLAGLVTYATYALLFWRTDTRLLLTQRATVPSNLHRISLVSDFLAAHPGVAKTLRPALLYAMGVSSTLHSLARSTYLMGHGYPHGTALFFPALFLRKMTEGYLLLVAILLLIILSKIKGVRRPTQPDADGQALYVCALGALLSVFSVAAVASPLNIGIRHTSVPIAALTILLGLIVPLGASLQSTHLRTGVATFCAIASFASCISMDRAFPDYIGYLNLFGGNRPGYEFVAGADLDWGQSLIELRNFSQTRGIRSLAVDVKGTAPPLYMSEIRMRSGSTRRSRLGGHGSEQIHP